MADYIDDAQAVNELHQRIAFQNHAAKQERPPITFDYKHCIECGDRIEKVRLEHKFFRCAGCQDLHERDQKVRAISGRI